MGRECARFQTRRTEIMGVYLSEKSHMELKTRGQSSRAGQHRLSGGVCESLTQNRPDTGGRRAHSRVWERAEHEARASGSAEEETPQGTEDSQNCDMSQ